MYYMLFLNNRVYKCFQLTNTKMMRNAAQEKKGTAWSYIMEFSEHEKVARKKKKKNLQNTTQEVLSLLLKWTTNKETPTNHTINGRVARIHKRSLGSPTHTWGGAGKAYGRGKECCQCAGFLYEALLGMLVIMTARAIAGMSVSLIYIYNRTLKNWWMHWNMLLTWSVNLELLF